MKNAIARILEAAATRRRAGWQPAEFGGLPGTSVEVTRVDSRRAASGQPALPKPSVAERCLSTITRSHAS